MLMAFAMEVMLQPSIFNRFSIHLWPFVWNSHSQETAVELFSIFASYVRKNAQLPFPIKNMVIMSIKIVSKDLSLPFKKGFKVHCKSFRIRISLSISI